MTLAQLGAEVIRFDQIGGGLDYRRWPLLSSTDVSLYWNGLNRGKQSIEVDLTDPEIQDLLSELIAKTRNFLTNFPSKGWLAYDKLEERCADLVMVAITGNHDGSTALDYTVNCAVGYPEITGYPDDDRPINHSLPAWDLICGQTAALGILAADRYRSQSGKGKFVSLALADVAFAAVAWLGQLAEIEVNGDVREKLGNDVYGAYGKDFCTADNRRVMVVAITKRQWEGLLDATGTVETVAKLAGELSLDFSEQGSRFKARDLLSDLFVPWFQQRTLAQIAEELDDHGVCWGPYQNFKQMFEEDSRCSINNPLFAEVDQPGVGRHLAPGSPLSFGGANVVDRGAQVAPRLGEHTETVLMNKLGLTSKEVGSLVDRGVVALGA